MTRKELIGNPEYRLKKTARARGYVSRKSDIDKIKAAPYCGKYGEGFRVMLPAFDSTRYCFVEYYTKEAAEP